jgi:hypothetical protein
MKPASETSATNPVSCKDVVGACHPASLPEADPLPKLASDWLSEIVRNPSREEAEQLSHTLGFVIMQLSRQERTLYIVRASHLIAALSELSIEPALILQGAIEREASRVNVALPEESSVRFRRSFLRAALSNAEPTWAKQMLDRVEAL